MAALFVWNGENLREAAKYQQAIVQTRTQARRDSDIALARAESCLLVRYHADSQNAPLTQTTTLITDPVSNVRMDDGTTVCTINGSTAIVRNGKATDIKPVARKDFDRFKDIVNGSSQKPGGSLAGQI